ncbi:hypothetical protein oki421_15210 [Helicobacter pylori]
MKEYNIFISHSWEYHEHYVGLYNLLDGTGLKLKNYSVPKDDPIHTSGTDKELYNAIENKIKPCSCVIILAGVYSTYSKWIDKEIKIAKKYSKKIIAVRPRGNERISQVVSENADCVVCWNSDKIKEKITS